MINTEELIQKTCDKPHESLLNEARAAIKEREHQNSPAAGWLSAWLHERVDSLIILHLKEPLIRQQLDRKLAAFYECQPGEITRRINGSDVMERLHDRGLIELKPICNSTVIVLTEKGAGVRAGMTS